MDLLHPVKERADGRKVRYAVVGAGWIAEEDDRRDFTIRALAVGIHVLCEKPMAPTIEDCRAMIEAGQKSGSKLMIAYRLHFEEATLEAIDTVRSRKLGQPRISGTITT
jgi:predicted dehydrogenase